VGGVVTRAIALGADATAEDFEDALDAAIDDPDVDSVVAVYIPPLDISGEEVANVLAAVGEQSDKPLVSTFLGAEGIPELLRVPDVAGSSAGRGSVPSYPAVEAAVRALARVVEYAVWLRTPDGEPLAPAKVDARSARNQVQTILVEAGVEAATEGIDLTPEQVRRLLAAYDIEVWPALPVASLAQAKEAAEQLGWDVVLKATQASLRERPDQRHIYRNITTPGEMKDAWAALARVVSDPKAAGFVVQKTAAPGVPLAIRSFEDPLFGPVVSFGVGGPVIELLGDWSYRIPPLDERAVASMVREVKTSPLLFGYRGAEPVDIDAVEDLLAKVAELQNDLPEVSSLELALVMAGVDSAAVLTARARVARVKDPRPDSTVRRMPDLITTIPG
jgi:acyl-CoA synthetase (NDP forming)